MPSATLAQGLPTQEACLALTAEALADVLAEAARLEHRDCELLRAVEGRLAEGFEGWPLPRQAGVLGAFARLQWRSEVAVACARHVSGQRDAPLAACSPEELSRLAWALARLDCGPEEAAPICRTLGSSALARVEAFGAADLARLAGALCRLGAQEAAWGLYMRVQRAVPDAGNTELRGCMLSACERSGQAARALSVLSHMAIIPRIARGPTWRTALASTAVLLLWRMLGPHAAKQGRRALMEGGGRKNRVVAALEHRLADLPASAAPSGIAAAAATSVPHGLPAPERAAVQQLRWVEWGGSSVVAERDVLDPKAQTALQALRSALDSGPRDKTADRQKEFELLRHLCIDGFPWDAELVLRQIETFATRQTLLKLAGGVKRRLIERVASEAPAGIVVELGCYVGYSAAVLALARGARPPAHKERRSDEPSAVRVVAAEIDPVNAVVARNVLLLAGLAPDVDVWVGGSGDVARYVADRFGAGSVAMLLMGHRGDLFQEDLRSFQELGLLADGARVMADNALKPGAPAFLWPPDALKTDPWPGTAGPSSGAQAGFAGFARKGSAVQFQGAGGIGGKGNPLGLPRHASQSEDLDAEFVEVPEFGLGNQALLDWVAVCTYRGGQSPGRSHPHRGRPLTVRGPLPRIEEETGGFPTPRRSRAVGVNFSGLPRWVASPRPAAVPCLDLRPGAPL